MLTSDNEFTSTPWGWEQYFEELSTVICSLERGRIAYANESYTDYVLDQYSESTQITINYKKSYSRARQIKV